jgi:hypothetical protein
MGAPQQGVYMKDSYSAQQWKVFRAKVIEKDFGRCSLCERTREEGIILQVHHKIYFPGRKPWDYEFSMVQTLCKRCHSIEHGIIPPMSGWDYHWSNDIGDISGKCDYCEKPLRHEHLITHQKWPALIVGSMCCDKLTGTGNGKKYEQLLNRERIFKKLERWTTSTNGAETRHHGNIIVISRSDLGYTLSINKTIGRKIFETFEDAQNHYLVILHNGSLNNFLQSNLNLKQRVRHIRRHVIIPST